MLLSPVYMCREIWPGPCVGSLWSEFPSRWVGNFSAFWEVGRTTRARTMGDTLYQWESVLTKGSGPCNVNVCFCFSRVNQGAVANLVSRWAGKIVLARPTCRSDIMWPHALTKPFANNKIYSRSLHLWLKTQQMSGWGSWLDRVIQKFQNKNMLNPTFHCVLENSVILFLVDREEKEGRVA